MTISNNLQLSYDISGPENGESLILLHAIGTNRHLWDQQLATWQKIYRVIRCDLPGHGKSPVPDQGYTMFTAATALRELFATLSIDSAHIIGSSFGGMIGMALALDHPETVKSLIAADVRADAPEAYKEMWDSLIEMANTDGMTAVGEFMLSRWFGDARDLDVGTVSDALKSTPAAGFIAAARAIQNMDFAHRLGEITCPTLLLVGENDGVLPELMSSMSRTIRKGHFVEIKGAGHLPCIDHSEAFTASVNEFLADLRT